MSALQRHIQSSVLVVATVLIVGRPVSAQFGGSGSIQGTVQDASKAALPGATVTARSPCCV